MNQLLEPLAKIIQHERTALVANWIEYFPPEERESEMRYYSDFLSFFDECLESDLDPVSDEAIALSNFLKKVAEIRGEESFYNFRNSVYTCYLKFPLFKALDQNQLFHYYVNPMTLKKIAKTQKKLIIDAN